MKRIPKHNNYPDKHKNIPMTGNKIDPVAKAGNKTPLGSVLLLIPLSQQPQNKEQLNLMLQTQLSEAATQIAKFTKTQNHLFIPKIAEKLNEVNRCNNHAKCAVIYISTNEEQLFYLNYCVEPKIIFNERFSIITLINNDKNLDDYLAVVLTGCYATIYKASAKALRKTIVLAREASTCADNEGVKQKCHLSNNITRKKQILGRYVNVIDHTLKNFLETQPMPVFVFGSHSAANYFSENSKYKFNIIEMFTTNYTDINEAFIGDLVELWGKHNLKQAPQKRIKQN